MTLAQFLNALDGKDIVITVLEPSGDNIIKFYSGTTALDDALESREIRKIRLVGASAIGIYLNSAE